MNKKYSTIFRLSYNCKDSMLHIQFRGIGQKFNTTLSSLDELDKTLMQLWRISNKLPSQSQSYCIEYYSLNTSQPVFEHLQANNIVNIEISRDLVWEVEI